jgi:hypothetical protein
MALVIGPFLLLSNLIFNLENILLIYKLVNEFSTSGLVNKYSLESIITFVKSKY